MGAVGFLKGGVLTVVKNDGTDAFPVQIIGGGASDGAIVDGAAAIKATVKDYLNANPLAVVLVDTAGDPYIASGAVSSPPGSATRTSVPDSAVAVPLLASNASRKGVFITNSSGARLFLGYGSVDPTTTDYSFVVLSGQTWTMDELFVGQLKGIWETDPNDGAAHITELLP